MAKKGSFCRPSRRPCNTPLLILSLALTSSLAAFAGWRGGDDPGYPTKLANNGARHRDITRAWFGSKSDLPMGY